MIKVENLSYSFPQKDLYNEITFTLEDGDHCAFIGVSGSGKSTLVDIIMDPEQYMYEGTLEITEGYRIGYVSQFSEVDKTKEISVFEYIASEHLRLQKEIATICTEMETSTDIDPLLEKYQQSLDAFDAIGGDDFESNINKILNLADLMKRKDRNVTELSGGEFKLVQVIKEMLNSPDLMIMDEPDVFLDFENLNSLKKLINSHKGTMLVITHNRYLLNHCFNKILHLENKEIQEFNGRYIDYNLSLLENKIEIQELAFADTEEIERNDILIDRLRFFATNNSDPAKGKSLKSRMKIQDRLEARRIKTPFVYIKEPQIILTTSEKDPEITALEVCNYSLSFDELLLEDVNFEIKATDKVALIGPNGTGKTTLLREIFENKNDSIKINEDLQVAYLSQVQGEMLTETNTVLEEFFEVGFNTSDSIKEYLSEYGFDEEDMNQKIQSLSGGEKNLLQLAKISLKKADFLLLDEPTSHLDTYSQIALEKAIENYQGAILMVSHDFYSVVNCMDYVLLIENKTIRKMKIKKFKQMIYAKHFDRDYLEIEQNKKEVETKIELALKANDFLAAQELIEELENLVKQL